MEKVIKIPEIAAFSAISGIFVVGAEGFEPSASWTRTMRDTKLRHAPFFHSFLIIGIFAPNV